MSLKGPSLLQIAELGQSVIIQKSKRVKNIKDPSVQTLIDNLIATVKEVDGVGISANQVYQPLRVFIIASHPSPRYPNAPLMKPLAMINPILLGHSQKQSKDWEGCLSVPGIRGNVLRFKSIEVEYMTRNGKIVKKTLKGFISRIFQHELDHLNGLVYLERLEKTKDIISEKEFQKMVRKDESKIKKKK